MKALSTITALVALCAVAACQRADFESLGTVRELVLPVVPSVAAPLPPIAGEGGGAPSGGEAGASGLGAPPAAAAGSGEAGSGVSDNSAAGSSSTVDATSVGSDLTGSLGPNVRFESVASGYVIGRSAEFGTTTIYLLDHKVDCDALSAVGWLSKLPAEVQVIELMFLSNPMTGTQVAAVVSRAHGGMYGFSKTAATSQVLVLTRSTPNDVVEGSLMAMFSSGGVSGTFHADYCASGRSF